MDRVEEGVANFRDFQGTMTKFVIRFETREEEREKVDKHRARIHFALLGGLITLVVGLILWIVSWTTSFEQRHPHISDNSSVSQKAQDASRF